MLDEFTDNLLGPPAELEQVAQVGQWLLGGPVPLVDQRQFIAHRHQKLALAFPGFPWEYHDAR